MLDIIGYSESENCETEALLQANLQTNTVVFLKSKTELQAWHRLLVIKETAQELQEFYCKNAGDFDENTGYPRWGIKKHRVASVGVCALHEILVKADYC